MEHEAELQRLQEENAALKKRINDFSTVENAKKKLETKVEQLDQKVGFAMITTTPRQLEIDGNFDPRESLAEGQ